jgi:hypothetical protein
MHETTGSRVLPAVAQWNKEMWKEEGWLYFFIYIVLPNPIGTNQTGS